MGDLERLLSKLAEESDIRVLSPATREKLESQGIHLSEPPKRTVEESIDLLFGQNRKEIALEAARKLPEPLPDMAAPSIHSLHNEIRAAIILGLNGAAITLSGILVEHALKYATYKAEMGGFAKYDANKADEFEKFTLGPAIDRAAKAGLLTPELVDQLRLFKDAYRNRNPYNHYNLKKITRGCHGEVSSLNIQTMKVEIRHVQEKDSPVIQSQMKPHVDAASVFRGICIRR